MSKIFNWCGYNWTSEMEGGRLIHPGFPYYWYDEEQVVTIEDNLLGLYQTYKPVEIKHWDGKIYNPTLACGTIRSIEDFSFGRFSCEIKLPHGYNLWPSFWLSGSGNWPPEIDIMEAWSYDDNYFKYTIPQFPYFSPSWKTTTNVHYNNASLEHESVGSRNISIFKQFKNPAENFIEYAVEWKRDSIKFYANKKLIRTVKEKECNYLIENLIHPENGFKMNVIFNVWTENPKFYNVAMLSPMLIRNFKYTPFDDVDSKR